MLKGRSLDKSVPSNHRPISNLNFISEVLERLFLSRFQPHILDSPYFNEYQSAYRPGCSTETTLKLLLDHIYSTSDEGKPMLLVSLDLSAAFDVVDHAILLKRLSCSFGVTGVVHSYLHGWTQSIRIGPYSSAVTSRTVGVPARIRPWPTTLFLSIHLLYRLLPNLIRSFSSNTRMTRNFMSLCRPLNYCDELTTLQLGLSCLVL